MSKYVNQTDLGAPLGLSAVAVGKKLVEIGLRDAVTGLATDLALQRGIAKNIPYKDEKFRAIWHRDEVSKILKINLGTIDQSAVKKAQIAKEVRRVRAIYRQADQEADAGNDKIAYFMIDEAFNNVPKAIRGEVRAALEAAGV